LADETKNIDGGIGELRFEFHDNGKEDSDKEFTSSVKNLLILVKDFYGADSAAVYWFNKNKQGFKILAASEDTRIGSYKERFPLGNDYLSTVCLKKNAEIINVDSESEEALVSHYEDGFNVKSIIASPLLLGDEVVAVVLCESKTLNFFGTPNVYTLRVFSESITNYIKYYSLNEDFEFEDKILRIMAGGMIKDKDGFYGIIENVFDRYVDFENLYIIFGKKDEYKLLKILSRGKADRIEFESDLTVEEGSIALKSANDKKIVVRDFSKDGNEAYRFSVNDKIKLDSWFCSIPVLLENECIGIVAFDSRRDIAKMTSGVKNAYKLIYPLYLYLAAGHYDSGSMDIKDGFSGMYNLKFFNSRLEAEMSKCRLFNDNNLYCVLISIDNIDSAAGSDKDELEHLMYNFLKNRFAGYDMLFRLGENKCALISNVSSDEKVFLEIEKLRKSLSAEIYNKDGKDINFTASFAIKRYDDHSMTLVEFLREIDGLLEMAKKEGGDVVKI
jgi:diguanylate cyclase (GGDEF)-like protein